MIIVKQCALTFNISFNLFLKDEISKIKEKNVLIGQSVMIRRRKIHFNDNNKKGKNVQIFRKSLAIKFHKLF